MNQLSVLCCDEPTELPREWNIQPTEDHFKYRTSPPKNSPVVSAIMGRLNHHSIDNSDIDIHPSEFPIESSSESVTDPDTSPTKSIYCDEIDHLLGLLHSEHDDYLLDVNLQIFQY